MMYSLWLLSLLSLPSAQGNLRGSRKYHITYFNSGEDDNEDRLKEIIKEHQYVAVSFVDEENCSHCDQWKIEYRDIAHRLKASLGIYFVEVKGNRHPKLMNTYGVLFLPSLKFFGDNWMETYEGKYTESDISYWLEQGAKPAVITAESPEELGAVGRRPRVILVCNEMKLSFENVAKREKRVSDWYFLRDETKTNEKCELTIQHRKEPVIKMKNVEDWDDGNSEEVQQFFDANKIPIVGHVDAFSFDKYLEEEKKPGGKILVWFLYPDDVNADSATPVNGQKQTLNQMMHEIASHQGNSDKFAFLYAIANEDQEMIDTILFAGDDAIFATIENRLPTLVVQMPDEKHILYEDSMGLPLVFGQKQIEKFLSQVQNKEILPKIRSEPVPVFNDGPVKTIVASTMKETFFKGDCDVTFLVYAPWCGHCTQMNREFEKVADLVHNKLKISKDQIKFTKMDGDANECTVRDLDYDAFPTVFYIRKGSPTPMRFVGENLASNLWMWIKTVNSDYLKTMFKTLDPKLMKKIEDEL